MKFAKLTRSGKGKKRARGVAQDPAAKYPRFDLPELSHNIVAAMDSNSTQYKDNEKPSWRRPSQNASFQANLAPPAGFANNAVPMPFPQYGSGYSPYVTPSGHAANSSPHHPEGNVGGSEMAFGSFDVPKWQTSAVNYSPAAPAMPMIDPRFFAAMMGNLQGQPHAMPFNNMAPFQGAQPMSTMARPSAPYLRDQKRNSPGPKQRTRESTPPVDIPSATPGYMKQASQEPHRVDSPRPLLVILDLNGTLICRKHKRLPPSFASRAGLDHFLDVLTKKYAVMIWSSSKPATVEAISAKLFSKDKKRDLVALWGRDKFGLTSAQYNAKLQVYKQLHKIWGNTQIQSSYPGNESLKQEASQQPSDGKHAASKLKQGTQEMAASFPVGQRWDQTNTILIDDSKLKALSEPYNILEIPEFTNDKSIDESNLFTTVLARLDTLSRHDDVSKVLREWNESATELNRSILDLYIPPEDFDVEEGGISLSQHSTPDPATSTVIGNANALEPNNSTIPTSQDTQQPPTEPEAIRLKKEQKKARKKEKKAAKKEKAAEEAARQASLAQLAKANANANPNANGQTDPSSGTPYIGQRKRKALRKAQREQEQQQKQKQKQEVDPLALDPESIDDSGPRYSFRTRRGQAQAQAEAEGQNGKVSGGQSTTMNPAAAAAPLSLSSNTGRAERSPSPATSSASGNSLLDRLEDGLGFSK